MRGFFLFVLMLFPALVLLADVYLGDARGPGIIAIAEIDSTQRAGVVGQPILAPLEVVVRDASGNGVEGVRVVWSSGEEGGTMAPITSTTDDQGVASSQWTLGRVVGTYTARAFVSGLHDSVVAFHASALPDSVSTIIEAPSGGSSGAADSVAFVAADRFGNPVPGVQVGWRFGRTQAVSIATTSDSGLVRVPVLRPNDSLVVTSSGVEVVLPPAVAAGPPADASWIERVSGVPPARIGHAIAYDPANNNAVLFGGSATDRFRDMWLWTAGGWNEARPTTLPPARIDHAMAYDGAGVILFGGIAGSTVWDDLWLWDGRDWTELTVARGPAGRYGHAMVRDASRGVVVLFGGVAGQSVGFADTWTWDGSSWRPVSSPLSPSQRVGHAMAYDSQRQRIVLFGGSATGGNGGLLRDTWEYSGNTWSRVPTPVSPPGLTRHAMTFDQARGRVVLFGGATATGPMDETWEYDGRSWSRRTTDSQPEAREDATMFFDPTRLRVVLYGGGAATRFSDTWEYRIP